jgi:hypothetical protein
MQLHGDGVAQGGAEVVGEGLQWGRALLPGDVDLDGGTGQGHPVEVIVAAEPGHGHLGGQLELSGVVDGADEAGGE